MQLHKFEKNWLGTFILWPREKFLKKYKLVLLKWGEARIYKKNFFFKKILREILENILKF